MKRRIFATAVLLLFAGFSLAQTARKIKFVEYDLPNGLHVILHEDHSTPIVAITVSYHVGSKNEKPDRTGFAHFFEHLMFEGSKNIKRGEYFKIVQSNGGTLNANTSWDRTFYYEVLPSNQLKLGLWLESERMLHLKIDSIGVETQRKVVKEERKQRFDNQPYGSLIEQTFKHAYKVHPYRWTPIGSVQYIDRAKLSEFIDFYKTYYVPNNATLSIAGDINIPEAKKWIAEYFGSIPRGTRKMNRPDVVEPPQEKEVRDTVYDNIHLPLVLEAYHIPAETSPEFYAIDMLTTLLSGGRSSRIYKELVDKSQKALQAGSVPLALEDPGLFVTYAVANVGVNPSELETLLDKEIEKVKTEPISDKEFQKLRNQIENRIATAYSTDLGIAEALSDFHVFYHNTNLINNRLANYMKVTKKDIQNVARKYLNKNNRVVLYYLPKSQKK
jgi:predicted Zn-dependent peptidase